MKYDNLWEGTRSSYWLPAFSLPLLHWVKPFLPFLGLPDFILKQPLIWEQIYTQAVLEYQTAIETQDLSGKYYDQVIKQVVTKALQNLAAIAGRDVARDFERWVIAHFCCYELESSHLCYFVKNAIALFITFQQLSIILLWCTW